MIDTDFVNPNIRRISMYNGEVELVFHKVGHKYTVNGARTPGVTTILGVISKDALKYWAVNQAIEYLQTVLKPGKVIDEVQLLNHLEVARKKHTEFTKGAATLGSMVHAWIESYIKGENPSAPINREMQQAVAGFMKWKNDHRVVFLESEKVVYSRKYNYAGITDFICEIDGKKYIGDIKTSNALYPEYMLQVSAYRGALEEMNGKDEFAGMVLVRVPKDDGQVEIKEFNNHKENYYAFLHALHLKRQLEVLKKQFPMPKD